MNGKSSREARRDARLREEDESQQEERRRRLLQLGSAAAFLVIVAVAVLIVVSGSESDGGDTELEGAAPVNRELAGIPQDGMVLGDAGAEVTLIEFGDLQCPVCKGFSEEIVSEVIESKVRSGEAKIEFRNFVIISEESTDAGAAAVAAGRQGRGWDFIDLFYRNQGIEASGYVTDEFLTEVAKSAGVPDIEAWNEARRSNQVIGVVERTSAEAERLGLSGTPTFAVEGPATEGMETIGTPGSAGQIEAAIDAAAG